MLHRVNKYCSNCMRTERFLDLGDRLVCERCCKVLSRTLPAAPHAAPAVAGIVRLLSRRPPRRVAV